MRDFLGELFNEKGTVSTARFCVVLTLLTGLVLSCIPATASTGVILVGSALAGKAINKAGEAVHARNQSR